MRRALAQILFDDHDRAAAMPHEHRPSPRPKAARLKAQRKRTEDGQPVHSCRILLQDLATLTRNHVRIGGEPAVPVLARPTPFQNDIFNRLGISIAA